MNQALPFDPATINSRPEWIATSNKFNQLVDILSNQPVVAVDTESDSLYSYFEKVCLIQFSIPQADYLVDPLSIDVSGLGPFFANSNIQKIFHAAEYDFLSLKRDYGFAFNNLFDTMIAARILGWNKYGLGALLDHYFDVKLDKRFQRYNWSQRPLSKKAFNYAHFDTHYLIPLRELQVKALEEQGRIQEATEAFERMTLVEPSPKMFNPDDFWRIKGAKELKPQQQSVLRNLYILRDKIARRLDRPPFKVIDDKVLVELAQEQPTSIQSFQNIRGLGEKFVQHNAAEVLNAIKKGQSDPAPHYHHPNNHRPDDHTLGRYEVLRQWRNEIAAERGVEPDVIINNQTLMNIAKKNPKTLSTLTKMEVLGDWQRDTYGKKLITVLKNAS